MQRRTAIPMGTFLATLMNHCSRRAIFAYLTNELTQRASRYAWTDRTLALGYQTSTTAAVTHGAGSHE